MIGKGQGVWLTYRLQLMSILRIITLIEMHFGALTTISKCQASRHALWISSFMQRSISFRPMMRVDFGSDN